MGFTAVVTSRVQCGPDGHQRSAGRSEFELPATGKVEYLARDVGALPADLCQHRVQIDGPQDHQWRNLCCSLNSTADPGAFDVAVVKDTLNDLPDEGASEKSLLTLQIRGIEFYIVDLQIIVHSGSIPLMFCLHRHRIALDAPCLDTDRLPSSCDTRHHNGKCKGNEHITDAGHRPLPVFLPRARRLPD